jgi:DNA polymerase-3 subunit gamma/tau
MKYQVIARKFRPQVFEEVVGQNPIVQTLRNAIGMDRIGHAYLFCGPRGVGKTTTARLLAKALNCAEGPTATPCNRCPSCTEIAGGGSPDVLEIDAASNTGVDSIRELRENARYRPLRDRFKVFIVDEVHMLSTSAFNALLKILEEPPDHIAFIMATTERHKVPATILSRCQQFVFRSIPPAEIRDHLRSIAEQEGVTLGEGALAYIVKASEGSMRDAQSLLDQIIAFGGQDIRDDDVRDVLGFIPAETLDEAVAALAERDSKTLVGLVATVVDQGLALEQFVGELLGRIRDLLMARLEIVDRIQGSDDDRARIAEQAGSFSEQDLIRFFDILLKLGTDLRYTSEARFHVEIACIKLAKVGQLRDIEQVLKELREGGSSPSGGVPEPRGGSASSVPERSAASRARTTPEPAPKPAPPARGKPMNATTSQRSSSGAAALSPREGARIGAPQADAPPGIEMPRASSPAPAGKPSAEPDPVGPVPDGGDPTGNPTASIREKAAEEELVQRFLDAFKGELAQVRGAESDDDSAAGSKPTMRPDESD